MGGRPMNRKSAVPCVGRLPWIQGDPGKAFCVCICRLQALWFLRLNGREAGRLPGVSTAGPPENRDRKG